MITFLKNLNHSSKYNIVGEIDLIISKLQTPNIKLEEVICNTSAVLGIATLCCMILGNNGNIEKLNTPQIQLLNLEKLETPTIILEKSPKLESPIIILEEN